MASVTSLDKDMRKLRLERYTPQAANEVRTFIEESLGERLAPGDLLDSLKDGVVLCKLVNLAVPNTLRFKARAVMPFVQMENISLFLSACKSAPFNLPSHDTFLTVDLFESKDPAQVLQCLGSFSRAANRINPSRFPSPIGGRSRSGFMSPQGTGSGTVGGGSYGIRGRGVSNASNTSSVYNTRPSLTPTKTGDSNSGRWSPTKNGTGPLSPGVSSWSKKSDEGATSPAWNIAQYGYMGGASQGKLGVSFGGRRQITSAGPTVPNLAEKEKRRKEQEAESERQRLQAEADERRRLADQHAEEERARAQEEDRWAEETRKMRERERQKAEEEKLKWEEEEQRWREEEEARQREEREAEARLHEERKRARGNSDGRLRGQFLSQYQAENGISRGNSSGESPENGRIKELERELEKARERERQYERERQAKLKQRSHMAVEDHDMAARLTEESAKVRPRSQSRPRTQSHKDSDEVWREDERDYLRKQWATHHSDESAHPPQPPSKSPRPLPQPTPALPPRIVAQNTGPARPLPDPTRYASAKSPEQNFVPNQSRTDRFLSANPAPRPVPANMTYSKEIGGFDSSAERDAEDRRRVQSQQKTKASGWASKSLLEREMENERQRQQEWEESQKELKSKVAKGDGVDGIGGGIGGKWDVNQWTGYTGGDGQNRGSQGIGSGRRQIVGPRPPPGGL
ncbi:hypothetical protein QTJ16_000720 [Diplocarpon rosae]|uniref:Calponin-homology (CH) domain-containing protein n=1 Tax=Diplocarpon rosae TaxID=946125 RepID=A0AAD9T7M2_9HELO|nr:hypothetical protein QTJ16_000720 [Diplocarpon rosae]